MRCVPAMLLALGLCGAARAQSTARDDELIVVTPEHAAAVERGLAWLEARPEVALRRVRGVQLHEGKLRRQQLAHDLRAFDDKESECIAVLLFLQ